MDRNQASKHGVQAYKAGKGRAPALNQEFATAACKGSSTKQVIALLDAYTHGWTIASLADGQCDSSMPSFIELARIENA